jgi:hypothetical protein
MGVKTESEYMAFRPGDLTAKIEGAAKRKGCSKSDIVRKALEMYLDLEPLQPLATYLGAATYFGAVANAAFYSGFFSREVYENLVEAIHKTTAPVEEKMEPL